MKPRFVDLFCGIGIGSLGFVRAGFEIGAAVDIDRSACAVYKENLGVEERKKSHLCKENGRRIRD